MGRRKVVLADLVRPQDTSTLVACDEAQTAAAVRVVRGRLIRRRQALVDRHGRRGELDRIVASLRRLQNPQLAAYAVDSSVLLSEPFGALPCAVQHAPIQTAAPAVRAMFGGSSPMRIVRTLAAFGEEALTLAVAGGVRIAVVPSARTYSEFSPAVARLVPGIDGWKAPPAGLFVVEERKVLLRSEALGMTAAHEFAHALDAVLASRPRSYFSYESQELRHYFGSAAGFVNEYAASGLDEYFAESVRAYLEINDPRCTWLPLTRYELHMRDPRMYDLIERLFASGFTARDRRIAMRTLDGRHDRSPSRSSVDTSVLRTVPGSM